jgi:hypothetical protein
VSLLRRNAERRSPKAGRRVRRLLLRAGVATTLGRGRAGVFYERNRFPLGAACSIGIASKFKMRVVAF